MKQVKTITVLCVDDHDVVRDGLAAIISTQPDMKVVGEAKDGRQALTQCRELRPDVVVMDLRMPMMGGADATKSICEQFPDIRIIVLTSFSGDEEIYRALEAGAQAYLLKDMARTELLPAIRDVIAGSRRIPANIATRLAENAPRQPLTAREIEVLKSAARGLRNKEIGAALGIAEDTVKIHLKNIFAKLRVMDRTDAVVKAARRGIIHLDL